MAETQTERDDVQEESSALGSLDGEQTLSSEAILSLESGDLNNQCENCFENLRRCVKAAWAAAQIQYTFTQTKLGPIQNRLDEHRLRLEIWMSDCGIADGNLRIITTNNEATLSNGLTTLFGRIQDSLKYIYQSIRHLERDAEQSINDTQSQRLHIPAINESEERILMECDHLTHTLYELAKLQHSVQMALAIHLGRGPEAALRLGIKNLQDALQSREGDSESEEVSLSAVTEDNASHKSGDEKCSNCDLWFPWYSLSFHTDTCMASTDTRYSSSRIALEASTSAGKGAQQDIERVEASAISATGGTVSGSASRAVNNSIGDNTITSPPLAEPSARSDHPGIELGIESRSPDPPNYPRSFSLVSLPDYTSYGPDAVGVADAANFPRQDLTWYQIFMICIGGTVGIGFAITSGEIIAIAGPGGTLIAFVVVGVVAICVMEGVCEMINLWPMPNAMVEFVKTFVDPDLAIVVGVTYWYAYCCFVASLIIGAGILLRYFGISNSLLGFIYALCIVVIFLINCCSVLWFGWIQFWGGVLKILILAGIFILMMCIDGGANTEHKNGDIPFRDGLRNNPNVAATMGVAVLIAIPLAVFTFIGVELVTVTAFEAKSPKALRQPAKNIAYIILIIYGLTIGGISANVEWFDRNLPKFYAQDLVPINSTDISLLGHIPLTDQTMALLGTSFAPVIATLEAGSSYVSAASVLVGSLVYSVLSCANVSLYVASRTLYGLSRGLDLDNRYQRQRFFNRFKLVTPKGKIPLWSVIASLILVSSWLPFVTLGVGQQDLFQIMSSIASVGVLLVWASQCLAFIRYNKWLWIHKDELVGQHYEKYQRWPIKSDFSSYAATLQPVPAYLGLVSCLVIVFILNSATMWNGNYILLKVLNIYLGPAISLLLFVILKIINRRGWVKLSKDFVELHRALDYLDFFVKLGQNEGTVDRVGNQISLAEIR